MNEWFCPHWLCNGLFVKDACWVIENLSELFFSDLQSHYMENWIVCCRNSTLNPSIRRVLAAGKRNGKKNVIGLLLFGSLVFRLSLSALICSSHFPRVYLSVYHLISPSASPPSPLLYNSGLLLPVWTTNGFVNMSCMVIRRCRSSLKHGDV